MKTTFLIILLCAITCIANAQITTNEQAYGLRIQKQGISLQNIPVRKEVKAVTDEHKARIVEEDAINDNMPGPLRFAFAVQAGYSLENSGAWQLFDDGSKLWRLKVEFPGALSTNAYYDKFWLPDGAKFFVYSEETGQCIGAITSEYIEGSRDKPIEFATTMVYGENVVFEYYQPASVKTQAVISISRIDYGYRYVDNPYASKLRSIGDALSCQININCPQGDDWYKEKRAVARIQMPLTNGTGFCSCALVNNTNNDYTPYILTAKHCLNNVTVNAANDNYVSLVAYWELELPGCSNSSSSIPLRTTTGARVKASNLQSDFALFLLAQDPRNVTTVHPYYLGWDRSGNYNASGVGIHHPRADVKKINIASQISNHPLQIGWDDNTISPSNTHWKVMFSLGTTESGSSGSPLINNNHKVIGQLHGGDDANCSNRTTVPKYYGKFSISWGNAGVANTNKLSTWLDPANIGVTALSGIPPCEKPIITSINGPSSHPNGQYADFSAVFAPYSAIPNNASSYQWVLSPVNGNNVYGANTAYFSVAFYNAGYYQVLCKAQSSCGWGEYFVKNVQVYNPGSYSIAYPSPATTTLNVSFNPEQVEQAKKALQSNANASGSGANASAKPFRLDVKLYDVNGTLYRQATSAGELVTLDVSNLRNGVYVLHVSDGIAAKPEVHKIIVAH
jgi:hypothetical protein